MIGHKRSIKDFWKLPSLSSWRDRSRGRRRGALFATSSGRKARKKGWHTIVGYWGCMRMFRKICSTSLRNKGTHHMLSKRTVKKGCEGGVRWMIFQWFYWFLISFRIHWKLSTVEKCEDSHKCNQAEIWWENKRLLLINMNTWITFVRPTSSLLRSYHQVFFSF